MSVPGRSFHLVLVCDRLDLAGGVERVVCELANHWVAAGHRVGLLSVATPRDALHYPLDPRVELLAALPREPAGDHNHFDARSRPWRLLRGGTASRAAAVVSLTEADLPRFAALNPRAVLIRNAAALRSDRPVADPDGPVPRRLDRAGRPRRGGGGAVSPPGRPKGEHRRAQHVGLSMTPPGRPKGEHRRAQHVGLSMTPPGRSRGEHRRASTEVSP
ncbi:hypothetical protein ABXN37_01545 [Piscinibacter sakaiensis]|uniref:hypothetical protein n=1 Tax=Piscinibacter sakaiensis TaxID=1547922 RepID=UPI00372AC184